MKRWTDNSQFLVVVGHRNLLSSSLLEVDRERKKLWVKNRDWLFVKKKSEYQFEDVDYLFVSASGDGEDSIIEIQLRKANQEAIWYCRFFDDESTYVEMSRIICSALNISYYSKCFDVLEIPCLYCKRKISYLSKICLYCGKQLITK